MSKKTITQNSEIILNAIEYNGDIYIRQKDLLSFFKTRQKAFSEYFLTSAELENSNNNVKMNFWYRGAESGIKTFSDVVHKSIKNLYK